MASLHRFAAADGAGGSGSGSGRGSSGGGSGSGSRIGEFRVIHDASGVEGLHLALNVFDEAYERRLFILQQQQLTPHHVFNFTAGLVSFPPELFQVINAARDCGLFPKLQTPNTGHPLMYRPAGPAPQFPSSAYQLAYGNELYAHYDEEFGWGETILGVSLGAPCILVMQPDHRAFPGKVRTQEIVLPRRSVYVLSGRARYSPGYKHGIKAVGLGGQEPRPSWNPEGLRRSITLRSTMTYAQAMLRQELATCLPSQRARLEERLARLEKLGQKSLINPHDVRGLRQAFPLLTSPEAEERIPAEHALFLRSLPPHVARLYGGGQGQAEEVDVSELRRRRLAALGQPSGQQQQDGGEPEEGEEGKDEEEAQLERALALSLKEHRKQERQKKQQAGGPAGRGAAGTGAEVVDLTAGDSEGEEEGQGEGQPATPGQEGEPTGRKRAGASSKPPAKRQAGVEWREEADGAICILD